MTFSDDPFQRLTVGATYSRAFSILKARADLFLAISLIVYIPLALMTVTVMKFVGSSVGTMIEMMIMDDGSNTEMTFDFSESNSGDLDSFSMTSNVDLDGFENFADDFAPKLAVFGTQFVLEYIVFLAVAIAGQAAMAYAVGEMYADRNPQWLGCLKKGFSRWCDIFGAVMLVSLGIGVANVIFQVIFSLCLVSGKVIFILFGVAIFIAWMVCLLFVTVSLMILVPVLMIEGQGPINSLKRCWEVSWDNRCFIFCTMFWMIICLYLVTIVLTVLVIEVSSTESVITTGGAIICSLPLILYLPLATM